MSGFNINNRLKKKVISDTEQLLRLGVAVLKKKRSIPNPYLFIFSYDRKSNPFIYLPISFVQLKYLLE